MGLFKKKEKKEEKKEPPKLPELPRLPEIPESRNGPSKEFSVPEKRRIKESKEQIPMLPSFPNGSLGNKFSQNTIKEAVTGKKEVSGVEVDEFPEEEIQMMPKPPIKEKRREFYPKSETGKETEPIFIKIDKFEESFRTFEGIKNQISEIENMLKDLKGIKEKEEKELEFWEGEIKQIKEKIERIDRNIFSKK
jgi:hypothetical protein